jgi:hypothetical protein
MAVVAEHFAIAQRIGSSRSLRHDVMRLSSIAERRIALAAVTVGCPGALTPSASPDICLIFNSLRKRHMDPLSFFCGDRLGSITV